MKRFLIYLILTSMILHCGARLGVISFIYENRQSIAFKLGLIKEVSIALCSSDYEFDSGLHIETPDESDKSLPGSTIPHAREINLFIETPTSSSDTEFSLLAINQLPDVVEKLYAPPDRSIFHPPAHV